MTVITYWLTEHPTIVNFRWSPTQSYAATWSFLFTAVSFYVISAVTLHLLLLLVILPLCHRRRGFSLGFIPALHSLTVSIISAVIFVGILLSAAAEIRDTRWLWRRTRTTALQWFLCFPVGTRASGRVFFWSYLFYLSRYLHLFRTFFSVIRRRKLSFFQLINQSSLLCISFLWLEYSQSFQVAAILLTTVSYAVVYGYRFWTEIGLRGACYPFVVNCQAILLGCMTVCHVGVLCIHLVKRGGCNGIGAWLFNSVLNAVISLLYLKFYCKTRSMRTTKAKHTTTSKSCKENEKVRLAS
ncbi:PREDICTED: elongation of fatty acids protein 3-like [Camelina sativa]|uniref:Elongation of fatty acids protein 3-like n=1 Tax=Camelina sativa TaxID=90675 RepID=A0ABM0TME0_CAMSA|nr:PREDICTED: elongation of fatty acids protein 3-like [Camelina sativa]